MKNINYFCFISFVHSFNDDSKFYLFQYDDIDKFEGEKEKFIERLKANGYSYKFSKKFASFLTKNEIEFQFLNYIENIAACIPAGIPDKQILQMSPKKFFETYFTEKNLRLFYETSNESMFSKNYIDNFYPFSDERKKYLHDLTIEYIDAKMHSLLVEKFLILCNITNVGEYGINCPSLIHKNSKDFANNSDLKYATEVAAYSAALDLINVIPINSPTYEDIIVGDLVSSCDKAEEAVYDLANKINNHILHELYTHTSTPYISDCVLMNEENNFELLRHNIKCIANKIVDDMMVYNYEESSKEKDSYFAIMSPYIYGLLSQYDYIYDEQRRYKNNEITFVYKGKLQRAKNAKTSIKIYVDYNINNDRTVYLGSTNDDFLNCYIYKFFQNNEQYEARYALKKIGEKSRLYSFNIREYEYLKDTSNNGSIYNLNLDPFNDTFNYFIITNNGLVQFYPKYFEIIIGTKENEEYCKAVYNIKNTIMVDDNTIKLPKNITVENVKQLEKLILEQNLKENQESIDNITKNQKQTILKVKEGSF